MDEKLGDRYAFKIFELFYKYVNDKDDLQKHGLFKIRFDHQIYEYFVTNIENRC